jgi:hypothetical protein
MSDHRPMPSPDGDLDQSPESADIKITAQGDRRMLEAFYLELRELAKQNGLKIEYRLSLTKPVDHPDP